MKLKSETCSLIILPMEEKWYLNHHKQNKTTKLKAQSANKGQGKGYGRQLSTVPLLLSSPSPGTQPGHVLWLTLPAETTETLILYANRFEKKTLKINGIQFTISSSCCAFSIALSSLLFFTFSISACSKNSSKYNNSPKLQRMSTCGNIKSLQHQCTYLNKYGIQKKLNKHRGSILIHSFSSNKWAGVVVVLTTTALQQLLLWGQEKLHEHKWEQVKDKDHTMNLACWQQ